MEIGVKGTIEFKDGTKSRVILKDIDTYPASGMPPDYWFGYQEDETHRPVVHPDFGKKDFIKSEILLPELFAFRVFEKETDMFSEEDVKTLKTKKIYTENYIVKDALVNVRQTISNIVDVIHSNKKLMHLYNTKRLNSEIEKLTSENEEFDDMLNFSKRLEKWLMSQPSESFIKDIVS